MRHHSQIVLGALYASNVRPRMTYNAKEIVLFILLNGVEGGLRLIIHRIYDTRSTP